MVCFIPLCQFGLDTVRQYLYQILDVHTLHRGFSMEKGLAAFSNWKKVIVVNWSVLMNRVVVNPISLPKHEID